MRSITSDTNIHVYFRFRQKFKSFAEQYELRELHFHALMRTKECEVQLSLARAENQRKRAEEETKKSRTLNSQVSTFSQTETELRSQLNIYVEKFKQAGLSLPSLLAATHCVCPHIPLEPAATKYVGFPSDRSCIIAANCGQMVFLTTRLQRNALCYLMSNVWITGGGNSQQLQRAIFDFP